MFARAFVLTVSLPPGFLFSLLRMAEQRASSLQMNQEHHQALLPGITGKRRLLSFPVGAVNVIANDDAVPHDGFAIKFDQHAVLLHCPHPCSPRFEIRLSLHGALPAVCPGRASKARISPEDEVFRRCPLPDPARPCESRFRYPSRFFFMYSRRVTGSLPRICVSVKAFPQKLFAL